MEMRSGEKVEETKMGNSAATPSKGNNPEKRSEQRSATSSKEQKPKVVFVNKEKSAFSDKSYPSQSTGKAQVPHLKGDKSVNGSQTARGQKRTAVIDSDPDLDFGEAERMKKKKKVHNK